MNEIETLFNTFGPWMYAILMGQVMLLAMVIERAVFLFFRLGVHARLFLERVEKLIAARNLERAMRLSSAVDAPLGRVVQAGLEAMKEDPSWTREAAEKAVKKEIPSLYRRLPQMAAVAVAVVGVGAAGSLVLQQDAALAAPGWLGLPACWTPALVATGTGAVALGCAALFAWKAYALGTQLRGVPALLDRWGWQFKEREAGELNLP